MKAKQNGLKKKAHPVSLSTRLAREKLNEKWTLGVLHYLINTQTQIPVGLNDSLKFMAAIEKLSPLISDVARGKGTIIVNGKKVFEWNTNRLSFAG